MEKEQKRSAFEFKDLATAQEYLEWKKTVPVGVRRQVEAVIKGNKPLSGQTGMVLSDQFLNSLGEYLSQNRQTDPPGVDQMVSGMLSPLERIETKSGYLNVFETLRNPDVSWALKRKIYETQIKPALDWLIEKDLEKIAEDLRRATERVKTSGEEQEKPSSDKQTGDAVPPESDTARSSMEARSEKREGEPDAIFSVRPFYGGYFKQAAYQRLNPRTFVWERGEDERREPERENVNIPETKILSGHIRGNQIVALPLPYDFAVDTESIETDAPGENVRIFRNQNGDWHLQISEEGIFRYQLRIAPRKSVEIGGTFSASEISAGGDIHPDLQQKIESWQFPESNATDTLSVCKHHTSASPWLSAKKSASEGRKENL